METNEIDVADTGCVNQPENETNTQTGVETELSDAEADREDAGFRTVPEVPYDFQRKPLCLNVVRKEFESAKNNNFLKGCKWAPDGSCLLTNSEDHCLRLFNLPSQLCRQPPLIDESVDEMV